MRARGHSSQDSSFARFILFSSLGHLILFMAFFLKPFFVPSDPLNLKSALRVDLVALPDKQETKPAKPIAEKPKPVETKATQEKPKAPDKVEVKPKVAEKAEVKPAAPKVDLKKTKNSQQSAIAKLKQLEAFEKLKTTEPTPKEPEYKGNLVSEGTSLTGLTQLEFDRYLGSIETKIREEWNLPQWLRDSDYRAEAVVLIDDRGLVIHKQVTRPSGNDIFDSAVLTAIDRASPFPEPPARLRAVLATRGLVFRFPQ